MRKLLIDTDTASDDAVALLMALREPSVHVEAITTVSGNCALEQCVRNALICLEKAGTYYPPVYAGMSRPLFKPHYTSHHIHGKDGMGDMNLAESSLSPENLHAVDALLSHTDRLPGELEIVTLGPLTNIAMAVLKDPSFAKKVKHVYVMGGSGLTPGNITPLSEFNFYVDAEAANIVIQSGLPLTVTGWEIGMGEAFINQDDIMRLNELSNLGRFTVRCNKVLMEFNAGRTNRVGFDLPDPTTMAVALYPDIIDEYLDAYTWVEYKSETSYGHYVIDSTKLTGKAPNARVVTKIKNGMFKRKLFELLS
ncbi:nucleoside hydrolase [Xenorhabdus cabanillasii]|uniref:Pyrimidine-specific ribonucleoside hydrolase n=1 Tax=Xenorhabdus cabanillasii JM26 TaxID=1427517 RepID=W1JA25_9GAMM|nr:nucleoside hydrolase [Xenorhabdus cabanillasii]PHM76485.1 ribonucleoside hydrolase [Xenorhabdus cabanillasii JM26]CDL86863.1 Pyrimidine-specific ribonucleoside hydrolase [Xenorhabdus cabanillasii JM26]